MSSNGFLPVTSNTSYAVFLMIVARGSKFLYTRWPKPMRRPSPRLTDSMKAGTLSIEPISESIRTTASLAPPCSGPYSALAAAAADE